MINKILRDEIVKEDFHKKKDKKTNNNKKNKGQVWHKNKIN